LLAFLPILYLFSRFYLPFYISIKPITQFSFLHTFLISRHHNESCLSLLLLFNFLYPPYLESNISFQKPFIFVLNLHFAFPGNAILSDFMSLISKPPSYFDLHIFSHLIHDDFLPSLPYLHKKFIYIFKKFIK